MLLYPVSGHYHPHKSDYDLKLDNTTLVVSARDQSSHRQPQPQAQPQSASSGAPLNPTHPDATYVALYDYAGQRNDELALSSGQLVSLISCDEPDWWKVRALDGSNRIGFFPASYLAELYHDERPLQVTQTIQVSDGETCEKLLRGQVSFRYQLHH